MKGPLRLLPFVCVASLFASACHRKPDVASASDPGNASPPAATPVADSHEPSLRTDQPAVAGQPQKLASGVPAPGDLTAVGTDSPDTSSGVDAGIHKSIRLEKYDEVHSPYILESVDGETARIKRLDQSPPKIEEVRAGQTLAGSQIKVEKVQARRGVDKEGNAVDASRVTLKNPSSKEETVLVKDLPARSAASSAVLTSLDGGTKKTVKLGDVFTWPGEKDVSYKVIDIGPDQAVLQEVETGKTWTVPKR